MIAPVEPREPISASEAERYAFADRYWGANARDLAVWFGIGSMAVEYEQDRDYAEAGNFPQVSLRMEQDFLQQLGRAFLANADRVGAMHALPLQLIASVQRGAKNSCAAAALVGIPVTDALNPDHLRNDHFQVQRMRLEAQDAEAAERLARETGVSSHARNVAVGDAHLKRLVENQMRQTSNRDAFAIGGIESILFSMVLSSYAAFETLAADLWIAILNRCPQTLGVEWCKNHKTNNKKYDLKDLAEFGFDLSGNIGSFLVDREHASFQNLEAIKANYIDAFGNGARPCFEPSEALYLLAKVRNLIAHRGGLIDAQFKRDVKSFPQYADQKIGEHLLLTGGMVKELVTAGFGAGTRLFHYVDNWASGHVL